jgi:UDP-N-acetylmuramate dehydrogenase
VSDPVHRAEVILRAACGDRVRTGFRLAPLTSFRIGGRAALFLEPASEADLVAASEAVRETAIPVVVLGKGSNVLVADDGFPGLVLRLGRGYRWAARDGVRLRAGAAMPLPALAGVALSHGLSGLEFGVAIPGSLGGAVRMNAGAHGADLSGVLETIDVFELTAGAARAIPAAEAGLTYRRSALPADGVVVAATVVLAPAPPEVIRARMDEAREQRRRTQPLAEANCGSVFKNPPGDHAGRLIDAAGGKGVAVGGASVSTKHANFIVTSEGARAADVLELIRTVQDLVAARFDVRLEPEVHLVGDLDPAAR